MTKEDAIKCLNTYAERARLNVIHELECEWEDLEVVDQATISLGIIEGIKSGINFSQEYYGLDIEDLTDVKLKK